MLRIIKRMDPTAVGLAVFYLLVQCGCALYLPYLTADMVTYGVLAGDMGYVWSRGILMIACAVVSLAGAVSNTYVAARISYKLGCEMRRDVFKKTLQFSRQEYDKFGAASLITRNTGDVTQVQNLVEMGLKFLILCPIYLVGGIILTYRLSPQLSYIFLAALPLLTLAAYVIYRFASPLYGKIQELLDQLNLVFREGLAGTKVIRAFCKEEEELEKYQDVNRDFTRKSITAGTIMSVFVPMTTFIISLATVLIVWMGGRGMAAGTIEVGAIMGAISYASQILVGFSILTMVVLAIPKGKISADRICEVLDTEISVYEDEDAAATEEQAKTLAFSGVDFRYPGASGKTLENLNFVLGAGQTLAVVGGTGEGKTSLVQLVSRLYDVENGSISLGERDIRAYTLENLHQKVSYAPQKTNLFMGTIRENMIAGKKDAGDGEIWAALEMADAAEFVDKLEEGLDSPVEKNGGNFSGGQRQRLCIARTLLKDADVYIFDDSFSALDFKTDARVRKNMKRKTAGAITIIVAQRISTVMQADLILVLEHGRVAGLGTHEELSKRCSVYREILESQFHRNDVA